MIASGEQLLAKVEVRTLFRHIDDREGRTNGLRHSRCIQQYQKDFPNAAPVVPAVSGLRRYIPVTAKHDIICKIIVTVFSLAVAEDAMSKLHLFWQMQVKNGVLLGNGDYINSRFAWSTVELIADHYREMQLDRITSHYSLFGDGSTDRRMCESEISYVRCLHKDASTGQVQLRSELLALEPIDTSKSRDGKSFDAQATKAACDAAGSKLKGDLYVEKAKYLVSLSLDGASVMMGSKQSAQALFKSEHIKIIVIHAVAHRLELAANDACGEVMYLTDVEEVCCTCVHLCQWGLDLCLCVHAASQRLVRILQCLSKAASRHGGHCSSGFRNLGQVWEDAWHPLDGFQGEGSSGSPHQLGSCREGIGGTIHEGGRSVFDKPIRWQLFHKHLLHGGKVEGQGDWCGG